MSVHVERAKVMLSRLREPKLLFVAVAATFGLLLVLSGAAFGVDELRHSGKVARNVQVGGREVSGYSKERLAAVLAEVDRRYATTEVKIDVDGSGNGAFQTDAGQIGLRVDPVATSTKVMHTGRSGSLPSRWMDWLLGFTRARRSELALSVDRRALDTLVAERGKAGDNPPEEARITVGKKGKFVGLAGKSGQGINADELAKDLPVAAEKGTPIRLTAKRGEIKPRFTEKDAEDAAGRAEALVADKLPLVVENTTGSLGSGTLRTLLASTPGRDRLDLVVDEKKAGEAVAAALSSAGSQPKEPSFSIDGTGHPVLVPGTSGKACCGPDTGAKAAAAILVRPEGPVQFDLVDRPPKTSNDEAAAFGVKEAVKSFTTKHPAGQPRVKNIHRMADLVRGQVIPPGESFSINGFVGKRTVEKGFVVDHAIADGEFVDDVGGGVSQFATTFFNAAWFAGLEFGEYQSHSLYISRYPKGRDATLGFPHPDLIVKNPSPYGVLIWPTYTDSSLTVTLYSTHWADVEVLGQDTSQSGSCTVYTTRRKRTFTDGRVSEDSTRALYRAAQGQDCGESEPSLNNTTTSVTKPGATTTTAKPGATTTTTKPPPTTAPPTTKAP
jgi:vancomycin resistance protein YoaR